MAEHDWQEAQSDWRQARREVYAEMLRDSVEAREKGQPPKYSKDQLDEVWRRPHPEQLLDTGSGDAPDEDHKDAEEKNL